MGRPCNMDQYHFIQFSGKAAIPEPLTQGHAYTVTIDGEITKITIDSYDNTLTNTYKLTPITAEINKDHGQTIKAKDTRSSSVKFRKVLKYHYDQDDSNTEDFETLYTRVYNSLITNADSIYSKNKI